MTNEAKQPIISYLGTNNYLEDIIQFCFVILFYERQQPNDKV